MTLPHKTAVVRTAPSEIKFTVPAVPVAQPRPRATRGRNGHARMHEVTHIKNPTTGERKPHPIAAFKATVRFAFQQAHRGAPLEGPIRVDVLAVFPRPKSLMWKTRAMPRLPHVSKPDRDNLDKAILDSLKSLAWIDDCQVCEGEIRKVIAAGDEQPHVEIRIAAIGSATEATRLF